MPNIALELTDGQQGRAREALRDYFANHDDVGAKTDEELAGAYLFECLQELTLKYELAKAEADLASTLTQTF